ncbi:MAG TPA: WYL domain-containing protein [Polyangiaceae bacterium]
MGQRSTTETLAGIYQAFLAKRTWRQPELAKELGIGVEALRRVLFELMEKGMPLERDEEERSRVYWSVPSDWFPESVLFKREEVPELLRQLRRVPQGPGRKRLLDLVLARLPRAKISESAVVPPASRPEEEQFLDIVEQSASDQVALSMRYVTAARGDVGDRHASVHRVLLGPPARLVATCHRSGTLKTFRVDSIVSARLDPEELFRSSDAAALDAYLKASVDGFHGDGAAQPLTFLVRNPDARWVKNNLPPGMKAEPTSDGVRVSVHTAALRRVAQFVVGLGASAAPESPALAREVAELARGALEAAEAVVGASESEVNALSDEMSNRPR